MPSLTGFVGPSAQSISRNINDERSINRFTEISDSGTPKTRAALLQTPGLLPFCVLASGPVRGLFYEPSYNRLFAVAGAVFWEVFSTHTATARGTLAEDSDPATMVSNSMTGHQLLVCSGGQRYVFDLNLNSFIQITAAYETTMVGFVNGLGLALRKDSNQFFWSSLYDFTQWSDLDFAATESPNNVLAMVVDHLEVWLFGQRVTEVWQNVGQGNTIFQPISGAPIEQGIVGSWLWAQMDNTTYWAGQNKNGPAIVYRANGYSPQRVSNVDIDFQLQRLPRIDDALAFAYQQNGHPFLWMVLPHAETDFVLDGSTGLWHERALWNPRTMSYEPHIARCHTFAFGKHLVGDRTTGIIYELSTSAYTDSLVSP